MFIDYYSILGVSFPSNDEEINVAYIAKKETLGADSENSDNSNYPMRVNIELAYRILGASYVLKTAYDKEYQNAIEEGFDVYEIKNDWLQSGIEREREYVINWMLNSNTVPPVSIPQKKKSCGKRVLGCLGKFFLFYLIILVFTLPKKCMRQSINNAELSESIDNIELSEPADYKLKRIVIEKNAELPRDMDENITVQAVLIENEALVYVYKVDDNFFSEIKDNVLSKSKQLYEIKSVYYDMKPMIDLLLETHRGIYYRYICRESGEVTECRIDYSDLADL